MQSSSQFDLILGSPALEPNYVESFELDGSHSTEEVQRRSALREAPSWIMSFAIHLTCFLAIVSLTAPSGPNGNAALVLELSQSDGVESKNSSVREVTLPQSLSDSDDNDAESRKALERLEPLPIQTTEASRLSPPQPDDSSAENVSESSVAPTRKYEAITMRLRARASRNAHLLRHELNNPNPRKKTKHDEIVDRFILYDIGRLRGAEGALALRKFRELGPSAVPALVRGLNRSAAIHASCPVGVIASKLMGTLRAADDPLLTEYAVQHIGRNVSPGAPHHARIIAFRDYWLNHVKGLPDRTAQMLEKRGLEGNGEILELAMSLTHAPIAELLAAVESPDPDLSIPAMIALLQRANKFSASERARAQRSLVRKAGAEELTDHEKTLTDECLKVVKPKRRGHR